jgi:hypothetical protein
MFYNLELWDFFKVERVTRADFDAIMEKMDIDRDGSVDLNELVEYFTQV